MGEQQNADHARFSAPPGQGGGLVITEELIEEFLTHLRNKGRTPETVATYRSYLGRIYRYLPEQQEIVQGTLENLWNRMEAEGFSANTINVSISAANSLLEYCGRRDLQLPKRLHADDVDRPEMTRVEYQALLRAARRDGKEQAYLLVKLFACTGVNLQQLDEITVELVHTGKTDIKTEGVEFVLPRCLREELEDYINKQGLNSGPIFVNQKGQPLNRATVSRIIASLADSAQVPREKCNPRCLQRLYQTTHENIQKSIFVQAQQMYEYLLEQEQQAVGWATEGEAVAQ